MSGAGVFIVTETFKDWDGVTVFAGTKAQELIQTGFNGRGTPFYNLILDGRVVAVTLNKPPCMLVPRGEAP